MRAKQIEPRARDQSQERKGPSSARMRSRPDRDRATSRTGRSGLRWVPAPLAVLVAAIGALVIGSLQGQVAAANAHQRPVYQAGGLVMGVDAMLWMSNDMSGQGPVKSQTPKGYSMPSSEMPGMQQVGDNRLRVEVKLSNVSSDVERYSTTDFSLVSPGGKTWHVDPQGRSSIAGSGDLRPGFGMTFDMYFDIPAKNSKHLTLIWSRDGIRESIPVTTNGSPAVMHM